MLRAMILVALGCVVPCSALGQTTSVLHIKVVLVDEARVATPVPRHRLLISDNPATAAPRLVVTSIDGTADVKLRPGNYTVESDRAVAFHGKAYQWTQTLDIVAGRDTVLELTVDNADVGAVTTSTTSADAPPLEADPELLLPQWADSVVALWTPTARASGFVVDSRGLIATNQRLIGTATSAEVQFTPAVKVAASVLVADAAKDVAVLRVDPTVIGSVKPVPLGCKPGEMRSIAERLKIYTISSPLHQPKDMSSGTVSRVDPHRIVTDLDLSTGGAGGPVFTADGGVVGITSVVDEKDEKRRGSDSPVVRVGDVCDAIAAAENKMTGTPPAPSHLPVEPVTPFPVEALKDAVSRRAGSLSPYQISSSEFDVAFITPVMTYGMQNQLQAGGGGRVIGMRAPETQQGPLRALMDFGNWSEYVSDYPPVLLVRVTPKMAESFLTTVGRAAAQTQGVAIPSIKHFKTSFSRMRAFCDGVEVIPIHPFKIEQRVSDTEVAYEGLYAFDPGAIGPQCGSVKLTLNSAREPDKEDSRVVEPRVLQQVWQDFAPYRAASQ
jgi:S1-C subfamily serine protease